MAHFAWHVFEQTLPGLQEKSVGESAAKAGLER